MAKRIGKQTILIEKSVGIISSAGVVGKKEYEGPMGRDFDNVFLDEYAGEESFEAAESKFLKNAIGIAMNKKGLKVDDIDIATGGDLLNQDMASTFGIKDFRTAYIGLFSACSSCTLGAGVASVLVDSGAANKVLAATSSHFCTAERQFRFPLEYGSKTTPNSQRTVTGAGAGVFAIDQSAPKIKAVTFGKVVDFGVTDTNNMGAAMAPPCVIMRPKNKQVNICRCCALLSSLDKKHTISCKKSFRKTLTKSFINSIIKLPIQSVMLFKNLLHM